MRSESYTIGKLAEFAGCSVQTIRYYEQIELMPSPQRNAGNQRVYSPEQAQRLQFICHARALGFHLDGIRKLLQLADHPNQPCATADHIAQQQLGEVEQQIQRLTALKAELQRMIEQCRGHTVSDCRVIEVLADHSKCAASDHFTSD